MVTSHRFILRPQLLVGIFFKCSVVNISKRYLTNFYCEKLNRSILFQDRHGVGEYEPLVDESQDWSLISGRESGEYTILQVSRKHVSGDPDDLCITVGFGFILKLSYTSIRNFCSILCGILHIRFFFFLPMFGINISAWYDKADLLVQSQ